MRYLKKFNESHNNNFLNDIEDCFYDFIDSGNLGIYKSEHVKTEHIELEFYLGKKLDDNSNVGVTVSELKSFYETRLSIIKDIEIGFKRLRSIYPDFHYVSDVHDEGLLFKLYQEVKEFSFYRKSGDLIILNFDKIRDILKLDKDVKLRIESGDTISFEFKNQNHFIRNMHRSNDFTDKSNLLINDYNHHNYDKIKPGSDFDKLIIDGENLVSKHIKRISLGSSTRITGREKWSVSLELNPKLKFSY